MKFLINLEVQLLLKQEQVRVCSLRSPIQINADLSFRSVTAQVQLSLAKVNRIVFSELISNLV